MFRPLLKPPSRSVPHRTGARRWARLAALLAAGLAVLAGAQQTDKPRDAKQAEAELKAVKAEIERIRRQVSRDQVERDRLTRDLREAEVAVAKAREGLDRVRQDRETHARRRAELGREKSELEGQLRNERSTLAGEVRAAYLMGREEPLKLLLNQRDPARAGRMLAYYGYFGRARAERIGRIEESVARLAELDRELEQEEQRLAALEEERKAELERLEQAAKQRSAVLAKLKEESRSREQSLKRLQAQQSGLEKLLEELRRAMERFPVDAKDAFARLRGRLAWPVTGKIVARFGETRAGGLKWNGVLIATERGTPVRAIYHGRVVYADWLPGLGLLTIIDHGDGYLSLYGHNERLYKAAGERVTAGDVIAAAGDSGGRSRTELYFEIRRAGRPVDPRPWFSSPQPRG